MNAYSPVDGIDCYLVVPPSYRPQYFAEMQHVGGGNLRCYPAHSTRPNGTLIPLFNGGADVFSRGPDRHDLELDVTAASDDLQNLIEEIVRRHLPVYVYPRAEGSVQANLPLLRGVGIDGQGMTVTHTLTLASGTRLYFPVPDAGRGVYMEEVPEGELPLISEIPTRAGVSSFRSPLGRGLFVPKVFKNLIPCSNLSEIASEAPFPDNGWVWTAGGDTWGTDAGTKATPWRDEGTSYWTKSGNNRLVSGEFDLSFIDGMRFVFSCCYRVSGELTITIRDSAGDYLFTAAVISHGSGRLQIPILPISSATETECRLRIELTDGDYAEIDCVQLVSLASPDSQAIGDCLPYLGTDEDGEQGEITASSLKVEGDFGIDTVPMTTDPDDWTGLLCVSGFLQPGFGTAYNQAHTIAFLERYLGESDSDVELRLGTAIAGEWEFGLYSGGTKRSTAVVATVTRGEPFAWVLYSGREEGALISGFYAIRLSTGTIYASTGWEGGIGGYANRLFLGARSTSGYGSNCLLSGISVSSVSSMAGARMIVSRLANSSVRYLFRRTAGRSYHLESLVTPRRFDAGWEGRYALTEIGAL